MTTLRGAPGCAVGNNRSAERRNGPQGGRSFAGHPGGGRREWWRGRRDGRKRYPKAKGKTDFRDYVAFWEKFQTQAGGGNPPDVFQNAFGFLRKYDKRGVLSALKSQIDAGI
ncbi:hypothetical protein [Streptomyces sp. NPDC048309]|uniref:hypothetical protein n=1 Tax=Streptomyces sp. NPDC048309 TaxID=3154618 RepID=UPI003410DEB9